jgi:hypothetical protein
MKKETFGERAVKIIRKNPEVFEALLEFEKTGRLPTVAEIKARKRQNKENTQQPKTPEFSVYTPYNAKQQSQDL